MEVSNLIKKSIDKINEQELHGVERKVQVLVEEILKANQEIVELFAHIAECKKTLRDIQLPAIKSVDL